MSAKTISVPKQMWYEEGKRELEFQKGAKVAVIPDGTIQNLA